MNGEPWTAEEVEMLIDLYPSMTNTELSAAIGRTRSSVSNKIEQLVRSKDLPDKPRPSVKTRIPAKERPPIGLVRESIEPKLEVTTKGLPPGFNSITKHRILG